MTVTTDPRKTGIAAGTSTEFYNFSAANMRKWRAAVAKMRAGTYRPKLALIGDSTTRGVGSNGSSTANVELYSYPEQLASMLTTAGLSAQANSWFGDASLTLPTADPRISFGTGWASGPNPTLGGGMVYATTGTGFLGFTPVPSVDTFDIYYAIQSGLGTATVNINGGATLATLNFNAAKAVGKTSVTGTLGTNQVRVTWATGIGTYIIGMDAYNSASKSISVMNMGWAAQTVDGYVNQGGAGNWQVPFSLPYVAPDLTIICLTINDWRSAPTSAALATYTTGLQSLITAAKTTGDCILMVGVPSSTASAPLADQQAITTINYTLAASNSIPVIDLSSRWSDYTTSDALGMYFDVLHPNRPGYADIAQAISRALLAQV